MLGRVRIDELPTPAALVDRAVLERNTARMAERVRRLGARLRPHVKTHKCVEAARYQISGENGAITVSTLAEAAHFARAGFRDVTYAVPISPDRLRRAGELVRGIDSLRLNLLLDHESALGELEAYGRAQKMRFPVFLKVDCGYHRAGVDPERQESVALAARVASSERVELRGILTHAGHSYGARDAEEVRRVARQEREVMVRFARRLRAAGIEVPEVSVGSTPTLSLAEDLEGVTEARPGNYVFYDRFQAAIGSCALSDVAFSVLATVIGTYPARNELVVDAGALALSKDPGPDHVDPRCGYGALFSAEGDASFPALRLVSLSQEHGKVASDRPIDFDRFPIGTKLRILPNHSCLAAALYERYHVVSEGSVVDAWKPVRGW